MAGASLAVASYVLFAATAGAAAMRADARSTTREQRGDTLSSFAGFNGCEATTAPIVRPDAALVAGARTKGRWADFDRLVEIARHVGGRVVEAGPAALRP